MLRGGYHRKNLQGDITGIIDSGTGKVLAEYVYDAYGNMSLVTDGSVGMAIGGAFLTVFNPLLYRGYVCASVGGEMVYYLGSRYYIPKLGRFLNADKYTDTGTGVIGTNMFTYCNNNPVMYIDPTGESAIAISTASAMGIGAIPVGVGIAYLVAYNLMLCVRLFQWSFTNKQKDRYYDFASNRIGTKNWSSFISNKLKNSQVIKDKIKKIIKKMGTSTNYKEIYYGTDTPSKISFYNNQNFSTWKTSIDRDLQWSIGSLSTYASFSIHVVKKSRTKYQIYCTLTNELWDFGNPDYYSGFDKYLVSIGVFLEDTLKATKSYYLGFSVAFSINMLTY